MCVCLCQVRLDYLNLFKKFVNMLYNHEFTRSVANGFKLPIYGFGCKLNRCIQTTKSRAPELYIQTRPCNLDVLPQFVRPPTNAVSCSPLLTVQCQPGTSGARTAAMLFFRGSY